MSLFEWFTSGFVFGAGVAGYACVHAVHTLPQSVLRHPYQIGILLSAAAGVIALACVSEWFPGCFSRQSASCAIGGLGFFLPFCFWEVLTWLI